MATMDTTTTKAAALFLSAVSHRFEISGAMLFGSRARETHHTESDADIAVFLKGSPSQFVETKLEMADIAFDVMLDTGILVQPLPVWETEWQNPETYPNPDLLANIRREGISL